MKRLKRLIKTIIIIVGIIFLCKWMISVDEANHIKEVQHQAAQVTQLQDLKVGETYTFNESVSTARQIEMDHVENLMKTISDDPSLRLDEFNITKRVRKSYRITVEIVVTKTN